MTSRSDPRTRLVLLALEKAPSRRSDRKFQLMTRPDPIPALKQQLGAELAQVVTGWNAHEIALLIGTEAERISDLRRGRLRRFSLETLIRYADRVRVDVTLVMTQRKFGRRAARSV